MNFSHELLATRLATAGVRKVAMIDDAFEESNLVKLADDTDRFWAQYEDDEDWAEMASKLGIKFENKETFETDGLAQLWRLRDKFEGSLGIEVKRMFLNAEQKLSQPEKVAANLRALGLDVVCFDLPLIPREEDPVDSRISEVQLVFLDYDLEGEDRITGSVSALRSHGIAKYLAKRRGESPFLILFSSLDVVTEVAERFREEADYLRGSFLFLKKSDATEPATLCDRLAPSCLWSRDIGHFRHFFVTLRDQLRVVTSAVEKRFLQLDVQDYAHFQRVALQEDGAALGEYVLDLFGAVLSYEFRNNAEVQAARSALDRLDLTSQHLPFHTQPTAPMELIYRAVLTEPGISVGPAGPHPSACSCVEVEQSGGQQLPPLLMLGDIFAKNAVSQVYVVLNSACDMQYSPTGRPPKQLSILLLPGKLESLTVPSSNPKLTERMRWLQYEGTDYRVMWELNAVISVDLNDFGRWQTDNGYQRIARLSLPYSLSLKQWWLSSLSRIGLPVCPPIHDEYDIDLFSYDNATHKWDCHQGSIAGGAIVSTHPASASEDVKFCLTVAGRDFLYDKLSDALDSLVTDRKANGTRAKQDENFWWGLVGEYKLLTNGLWKFNPAGSSRPALVFSRDMNAMDRDNALRNFSHLALLVSLIPSGRQD